MSLPGELILPILKEDYFNYRFRPDRRLLLNCSLVNKSWAAEAQPLLFRHVEVRRPSSFEGLKAALTGTTSWRGPLKDQVLWLRIWIGCNSSASPPETLVFLLRTCPNLYGLSVTLQCMGGGTKITLPPNIKALECCDWQIDSSISLDASQDIIRSGWDSLRFLTLRGYTITKRLELSPKLLGLRLDESCDADGMEIVRTKYALLPNLRFLDSPLSGVGQFIRVFCRSLESIHLPGGYLARYWPQLPLKDLSKCARLKEFRFDGPLHQSVVDSLQELPLEHLAFGAPSREASFLLDRTLEGISVFQHLRVVSCLTPSRPWDWPLTRYMNDLQRICTDKRIRLDVYTNTVAFRALTRGDPVPTVTFPRGLTVPSYSRFRLDKELL